MLHRLDITLTHKIILACHAGVQKMVLSQAPVMKMATVVARMALMVKNVTDVLLATGGSLPMVAGVSAQ